MNFDKKKLTVLLEGKNLGVEVSLSVVMIYVNKWFHGTSIYLGGSEVSSML